MYVPPSFAVDDEAAWAIIADAGAGTLVIASPGGLQSVFVPVVVSDDHRIVTTHVAKANPWWRLLDDGADVLGLFVTASAYVSPSNYPSRADHPQVVPTWNYVTAELRGRAIAHDDPEWLRSQVHSATNLFEQNRSPRWWVEDATPEYVTAQLRAIVGVEITVSSVVGKAKLSQNRSAADHDQVRDNFADGSLPERLVARRMGPTS